MFQLVSNGEDLCIQEGGMGYEGRARWSFRGDRGGFEGEGAVGCQRRVRWDVRGGRDGCQRREECWLDEPKTSHLRSTHRMCFHSNVHQPESVVAGNHIVHGVQWVGLHCSYYVTSGFIGGGVQRK